MNWSKNIAWVGVCSGLLVPLIFFPNVVFPHLFPKAIFFQVAIGLTFPAYLSLAWAKPEYRPRYHHLHVAIMAYMFAAALSVIFAADPFRSFWGSLGRMGGLFSLLHFSMWFFMLVGMVKTKENWVRLFKFQIFLSAFVAFSAIYERWTLGTRPGGVLGNPIYLGGYATLNLLLVGLVFRESSRRRQKVACAAIGLLNVVALVLSESRGPLLGLFAGICVTMIFYSQWRPEGKRRLALFLLAVVASCGTLFVLRSQFGISLGIFSRFANFSYGNVFPRLIPWKIAWNAFLSRPLTGWGLDSSHISYHRFYDVQIFRFGQEQWFDRPHNLLLEILSSTGMIGFFSYSSIFLTSYLCIHWALKRRDIDLRSASLLIAFLGVYLALGLTLFEHPTSLVLLFFVLAYISSVTANYAPRLDSSVEPAPQLVKSKFLILYCAFGGVIWFTSIGPFMSGHFSWQSAYYWGHRAGQESLNKADFFWNPYFPEQQYILAENVFQMHGRKKVDMTDDRKILYKSIKRELEKEIGRHPLDAQLQHAYATLLSKASLVGLENPEKAEAVFIAAMRDSPNRHPFVYGLAEHYFRAKRVKDGMELFRRMAELDPDNGVARWYYGEKLYFYGDKKEGIRELLFSQSVAHPYSVTTINHLLLLALVYHDKEDVNALTGLAKKIVEIRQDPSRIDRFLDLAALYHQSDLFKERDLVLQSATVLDARAPAKFRNQIKKLSQSS